MVYLLSNVLLVYMIVVGKHMGPKQEYFLFKKYSFSKYQSIFWSALPRYFPIIGIWVRVRMEFYTIFNSVNIGPIQLKNLLLL